MKTEAASYDHGDTVNISGNVSVDGKPVPDTTVSLKVVDSTSAEFVVGDVTTDADGNFSAAWIIPPEVAPGTVELSATALGATATTTFTFNNKCGRVSRRCLGLKV